MKWFRLHTEARTDAKLRTLTDSEHRVWFNLLCYAAEEKGDTPRGSINGVPRPVLAAEVARGREELLDRTLEKLEKLHILERRDGLLTFVNFKNRQYEFESEKPASTKARKRKSRDVTSVSRPVTTPEIRTQSTEESSVPSERPADDPGKRFFETTNRGQEVGALVDVAKAHGREVAGGILAGELKRHPKTAVMDALMQALGREAVDVGTYMNGVLKNGKAGHGTGRGKVVAASDLPARKDF